ncbi:transporter [Hyphomicrobiales bacterium 4NK60-0047b]
MSFQFKNTTSVLVLALATTLSLSAPLKADESHDSNGHKNHRADGHAPIGVMGDHLHKKGEFMMSYRFMTMGMKGNQQGTDNISTDTIATTVPNRFFGTPGQPQTVRVVPTEMTMDMHMIGAMFAPSDNLTLMAMISVIDKEMEHITYQGGGANTNVLGKFKTRTSGIGDLNLGGLYSLYNDGTTKIHFNGGLSIPTASITRRDDVLTPMGGNPTLRLPYPMQLGTGTWDLLPGLTVQSRMGDFSYGAQYKARFHLGDNDEGYSFGDKHELTGWVAYQWAPWISTSLRLTGITQAEIDGIDPNIVAPVQTANPDNFGGDRLDLALGVNMMVQSGRFEGHRFALEFGAPIYQDLNGVQLETDYTLTVGWQKAF